MNRSDNNKSTRQSRATKRCPECFTELSLDAKICFSCNQKVGKLGKHGLAKKPFNWLSYVICILSWLGFCLYIWWAFIR